MYWEDDSNNELGFIIERDTAGLGSFESLDSVAANETSFSDTNFVSNFDSLAYRVYAFSQDTVSGYSNIADLIIPVELFSFNAVIFDNAVIIKWTTATETNNRGFELERKLDDTWETISFIEGHGSTTEKNSYQYKDDYQYRSYQGQILYRLKQIDFSGNFEFSKTVELNVDFIPEEFILYQNNPNPFNPATSIKFSIPVETKVRLEILNVIGEEIELLINETKPAGTYDIIWNPGNISSGVYLYQLQAGSFIQTKKMILLK